MSDERKIDSKSCLKRKYHSKSRKGCSTCKKRRVKCDESKPECGNCVRMKLACGYIEEPEEQPPKRAKLDVSSTPPTQQVTPEKTPSPGPKHENLMAGLLGLGLGAGLLNAGNLNNVNLSHLVNNLSTGGADMSVLGNLANLSSLAVLAQLPIDLSSLGSQLSSLGVNLPAFNASAATTAGISVNAAAAAAVATSVPPKEEKSSFGSNNLQPETPFSGQLGQDMPDIPSISPNVSSLASGVLELQSPLLGSLNMLDLRLMYHYTTQVSSTITGAGISDTDIWNHDIPMLAFEYPFLMHALLAFSATHLSRTEKGLDQCVTCHRGDALRLLREAILDINSNNTDALVASALILIMDSLANASVPSLTLPKLLPASAWIFHVKGAATILTAVWPLTEASRFYKFIGVDLGDLGDIINEKSQLTSGGSLHSFANLECHDSDIADLYPVPIDSPYLITLAYLNKLHKERYKADFILRIFAFPALLEKEFLSMLMSGDVKAMRIMRSYYKLLRSFTMEMKDKVWFLEGVSQVLPVDVEEYAGGAGGMHMMLDFLGGGPAIVEDHEVDKDLSMLDPGGQMANKLIDTNNLPSEITRNLDVMQGDADMMGIKLE